jgi:hypothetical protein
VRYFRHPDGSICAQENYCPSSRGQVLVIDPNNWEEVRALHKAIFGPVDTNGSERSRNSLGYVDTQNALLKVMEGSPCPALLNINGGNIDCTKSKGHDLPHANPEHNAFWQGDC